MKPWDKGAQAIEALKGRKTIRSTILNVSLPDDRRRLCFNTHLPYPPENHSMMNAWGVSATLFDLTTHGDSITPLQGFPLRRIGDPGLEASLRHPGLESAGPSGLSFHLR